ncbi:MAG: AbrB/MazE/SpoVT family DNA-binding domain-containing protein [Candidatus Saliniplasma sp.]
MAEKAKISRKGQITIPKAIREKLGLGPGKKVLFDVIGKEAIMYPEIEDPLKELKQLRKEIQFDEEEIEQMMERSKSKWSKLS